MPPGFAHGFAMTSGASEVLYKTADYRVAEHLYFVLSRRSIP
jgi:dTDP-4-dehydrorhamnose 3,5-epimerase-like enzyme